MWVSHALRTSRRAFHVGRVILRDVPPARPPPGPNPLDEPTLALVKQKWKQARLAKDSDTATLLGVCRTIHTAYSQSGHPHGSAIRSKDENAAKSETAVYHQDVAEGD